MELNFLCLFNRSGCHSLYLAFTLYRACFQWERCCKPHRLRQ